MWTLAEALREAGLRVWFDEWVIRTSTWPLNAGSIRSDAGAMPFAGGAGGVLLAGHELNRHRDIEPNPRIEPEKQCNVKNR